MLNSAVCSFVVVLVLCALGLGAAFAQDSPVKFSHPDRIRYDGQCFTIEGKDTFIFSGAFHYFRCPNPLWQERFQKTKEAGFNAVETYVAWNWHDPKKVADVPQGQAEAPVVWYRLRFELPDTPGTWVPWRARLDASGNGFIYLNGQELGRYWEVGPQREYYLPECWLKFGAGQTNVLTFSLRPTKNGAALRAAEVLPYGEFIEKR